MINLQLCNISSSYLIWYTYHGGVMRWATQVTRLRHLMTYFCCRCRLWNWRHRRHKGLGVRCSIFSSFSLLEFMVDLTWKMHHPSWHSVLTTAWLPCYLLQLGTRSLMAGPGVSWQCWLELKTDLREVWRFTITENDKGKETALRHYTI